MLQIREGFKKVEINSQVKTQMQRKFSLAQRNINHLNRNYIYVCLQVTDIIGEMLEEDLHNQLMRYETFLAQKAKSKRKLQLLQDQNREEQMSRNTGLNKEVEENLKLLYLFTKETFHIVQMKVLTSSKKIQMLKNLQRVQEN
ncbi:unnamed protein product (macronuclear) [Paramecium tetraurelia]|uniref:Uncharacterized protein n=1 Tax=Paramecium tetraurelia TaxID=5888 RepID=A0BFP6_PARTE|nr:uncharacterized protein GSPATT00028398001 [Paramecium tetraurelia]CAK57363.1 unnamed protein product [Paramecium tetraurelia]|eukprot:XP_001424761.1 hypothetical protein (macronuclear) [Paramecium tetraurelia strain d4-2]